MSDKSSRFALLPAGHFDYKPLKVFALPCDLFSEETVVWLIILLTGHQSLVSS